MNIHSFIARENEAKRAVESRQNLENRAILTVEKRIFPGKLELRTAENGSGPGKMVGYAAKYNETSVDLGGFIEKLDPGCFDDIMEDDVRCLRNHLDDNLLGRTASGTLELALDLVGLQCSCNLPDTQTGRDTAEMIRRGDMSGMSFQFQIAPDGDKWDFNGVVAVRTITKVGRLYDVAPVTNPAYASTSVDMRSFHAAREAHNALEAEKFRQFLFLAKARLRLAEAPF